MTKKFSVEKDKRVILQKYTYIWEVCEVIFLYPFANGVCTAG